MALNFNLKKPRLCTQWVWKRYIKLLVYCCYILGLHWAWSPFGSLLWCGGTQRQFNSGYLRCGHQEERLVDKQCQQGGGSRSSVQTDYVILSSLRRAASSWKMSGRGKGGKGVGCAKWSLKGMQHRRCGAWSACIEFLSDARANPTADARQVRILKMCSYTVQRCAPSCKSLDRATASRRAVISAIVDMLCLVWSNACMHAKVHLNVPSDANHALSTGIKMRCRLLGDRRCFVRIMQPTQGGIWALMQTFCAKKHSFGAAVPLLLRTSFQDIHSAYAQAQFPTI